jgi:hypothetical protein
MDASASKLHQIDSSVRDSNADGSHSDSNANLPSVEELKRGLFIPEAGFIDAPPVPQPNIFPLGWRLETPKLAEI